ncbi:UNKNOWN [Stylonychia lemnae]|uniref:Uncharacterized protein n=1 Tax=Stylonychia lemnae TaxID=5949 RepID=A0A078AKT1_STYLE|nr:UNKNOWN [Stylonychia lemnae]|eukprot:CDW81403.1 UNKNOWN [Stylonychia lemnae]
MQSNLDYTLDEYNYFKMENPFDNSEMDLDNKQQNIKYFNHEIASTNSQSNSLNENLDTFFDDFYRLNLTIDFDSQDPFQNLPNKYQFYSNEMKQFNLEDPLFGKQYQYFQQNETYQQYKEQPQDKSNNNSNELIQSDQNQTSIDSWNKDFQSLTQDQVDVVIDEIDAAYDQSITQRKGKKRGRPFKDIQNENIDQLPNINTHSIKNVRCIARCFRQLISINKYQLIDKLAFKIRNHFKNDSPAQIIKKIENDLRYCQSPVKEDKKFKRDFKRDRVIVTNDNISILGRLCYRYKFSDEIKFFQDPIYQFLFLECMRSIRKEFKGQKDVLGTLESIIKLHF